MIPDQHRLWPSIRTTFASYFNWTVIFFCASFRQVLVCGCFLLLEPSLIRDYVVGDLHYIKDYFCNKTFTFFSVHMSPECWHTKFSHSMLIIKILINDIHNKMPWLSDLSQMLIYWNSEISASWCSKIINSYSVWKRIRKIPELTGLGVWFSLLTLVWEWFLCHVDIL